MFINRNLALPLASVMGRPLGLPPMCIEESMLAGLPLSLRAQLTEKAQKSFEKMRAAELRAGQRSGQSLDDMWFQLAAAKLESAKAAAQADSNRPHMLSPRAEESRYYLPFEIRGTATTYLGIVRNQAGVAYRLLPGCFTRNLQGIPLFMGGHTDGRPVINDLQFDNRHEGGLHFSVGVPDTSGGRQVLEALRQRGKDGMGCSIKCTFKGYIDRGSFIDIHEAELQHVVLTDEPLDSLAWCWLCPISTN